MSAEHHENIVPLPSSKPASSVVFITPEMARRWLGYNSRNRTVRPKNVDRFARDMAAGRWEMTGEAIKFNSDGNLLDGQHRLAAIIKSGTTVPSLVVRGLANESQDHMDTGSARLSSDVLALHGYANSKTLSAAVRLAIAWQADAKNLEKLQVTHGEVTDFITANPSLVDSAEVTKTYGRRTDCSPSIVAYTHWRLSHVDEAEASAFWAAAAEKVGLEAGDPVIALTHRFAEARRNRERLSQRIQLSLIFRAWNTRREGKTMKFLRVNSPGSNGGLVPVPEPK